MLLTGEQSDPLGIAAIITAMVAILGALGATVAAFLRHIAKKDERTEATIVTIVDRQNAAIEKHTNTLDRLNMESSERSQSIIECMRENKDTVKEAKSAIEEHNRLMKEYKSQQISRAGT